MSLLHIIHCILKIGLQISLGAANVTNLTWKNVTGNLPLHLSFVIAKHYWYSAFPLIFFPLRQTTVTKLPETAHRFSCFRSTQPKLTTRKWCENESSHESRKESFFISKGPLRRFSTFHSSRKWRGKKPVLPRVRRRKKRQKRTGKSNTILKSRAIFGTGNVKVRALLYHQ